MKPAENMSVRVTKNGPYHVTGSVPLHRQTIETNDEGESVGWRQGPALTTDPEYDLCRCGHSAAKPFCDGSHARVRFEGTETASREPYLKQADKQEGPLLDLTDAEALCAFARFCDPGGQIWSLVEKSDGDSVALAEREAKLCPSGRLLTWRRSDGTPLEADYPASIGLVEDPAEQVAGPLWVRGGVQVIAADGTPYEVRERVTLCRCGESSNKPFCDGTHASIGFTDR